MWDQVSNGQIYCPSGPPSGPVASPASTAHNSYYKALLLSISLPSFKKHFEHFACAKKRKQNPPPVRHRKACAITIALAHAVSEQINNEQEAKNWNNSSVKSITKYRLWAKRVQGKKTIIIGKILDENITTHWKSEEHYLFFPPDVIPHCDLPVFPEVYEWNPLIHRFHAKAQRSKDAKGIADSSPTFILLPLC